MTAKDIIERDLERAMYASRWILAPIYLGLSIALFALTIKFFQELYHFMPLFLEMEDSELILKLLTLIDLTLVGNLMIIVMFSGYENFVPKSNINPETELLDWLGIDDCGSLKMKVTFSIVAIPFIQLTMVVSALLMVFIDKFSKHG